jgi:hypothetical protein
VGRRSYKTGQTEQARQERRTTEGSITEAAMRTRNLRIEIAGGPINDYRITDRDLEFRALEPTGRCFSDERRTWRRLTANELVLHFRLKTVVANWFLEKIEELEADVAQQELPNVACVPAA